jgi:hypothetical protein
MKSVCVIRGLLVLSLAVWGTAIAQDEPPPAPPATSEASTPPEPDNARPQGDMVTLRNGRQLTGFRVVRETSAEVVLRLTAGGLELRLPRSQIASIERDEARRPGESEAEHGETAGEKLLHGVKLAPVLNRRLQRPLSEEPIDVEDQDFIERVRALSQRAQVPLSVSGKVREIPQDERRWNTRIPAGRSLFQVLNDHLLKDFPALAVSYRFDEVVITHASEVEPEADTGAPGEVAPPGEEPPGESASGTD